MDIKLRARLSAYGKLSLTTPEGGNNDLPFPSIDDAGSVVGVGSTGSYTLFNRVTESEIDSLFNKKPDEPNVVTKDDIDTLFEDTPEESPTPYQRVTEKDIDTLFAKR